MSKGPCADAHEPLPTEVWLPLAAGGGLGAAVRRRPGLHDREPGGPVVGGSGDAARGHQLGQVLLALPLVVRLGAGHCLLLRYTSSRPNGQLITLLLY